MTSLTSSPGGEFRIEPGGLFFGELFGADSSGASEFRGADRPCGPGAPGCLAGCAADLIDHGRTQFQDMERIQDSDGSGQLIADRVSVAAERIQRCRLDPRGEPGAAFLEPAGVGLSGASRNSRA
jgi:hypothetical protein